MTIFNPEAYLNSCPTYLDSLDSRTINIRCSTVQGTKASTVFEKFAHFNVDNTSLVYMVLEQ